MEVRHGYNQTDFGVVPVDWCLRKISEIGEVRGRVGWKGYTKKDLVSYGPLTIGAKHIDGQGRLDLSDPTYLSLPKFLESPEIKVEVGDILIVQRGTIGKLVLIEAQIGDATINPSMVILRLRNASPSYVRYFLLSEFGQRQIVTDTSSTGVPMISQRQVQEFTVVMPPTESEQRAIAAALSDVDALLGGLDQLIAKKRDLKQAAMQQLLTGQTRLPGFHGDWEDVPLGEIASPNRRWSFTGGPFGSNLKASDYTDEGVRIIQLQNIGDGEFKDDYEIYTSERKADELLSCNIFPGEIILSKMGDPVARACIIPSRHKRYLMCSDGIRLAVDPARFDTYFVYTQINAPEFRDRAANAGTGSTRTRIGLTELRTLVLRCPPLPEQTAIAGMLADMDAELSALEARRDKTRALKQGMMQELLTGRTRLV